MAKTIRDFESLIEPGEAKGFNDGFKAQTANGTTSARLLGWNRQDPVRPNTKARPGGAWQTPRSNRGGE
jgi:hypothetical protein